MDSIMDIKMIDQPNSIVFSKLIEVEGFKYSTFDDYTVIFDFDDFSLDCEFTIYPPYSSYVIDSELNGFTAHTPEDAIKFCEILIFSDKTRKRLPDGFDCTCSANSVSECCCGADWAPRELVEAREKIKRLEEELKNKDETINVIVEKLSLYVYILNNHYNNMKERAVIVISDQLTSLISDLDKNKK